MFAYTKKALMNSLRYAEKSDVLAIILKDDKCYTFEQVDRMISEFFNGKKKNTKNEVKK